MKRPDVPSLQEVLLGSAGVAPGSGGRNSGLTFQLRIQVFGEGHQRSLVKTNQHAIVGQSVSQTSCQGSEEGTHHRRPQQFLCREQPQAQGSLGIGGEAEGRVGAKALTQTLQLLSSYRRTPRLQRWSAGGPCAPPVHIRASRGPPDQDVQLLELIDQS